MNVDLDRVQKYLDWLKTKLYLDAKAINSTRPNIRDIERGQVYECSFGVGIGSEQEKNNRPCVILQNRLGNLNSPNTIVAPISHSSRVLPIIIPLAPQLKTDGTILLDGSVLLANITTVSKARLGNLITVIPSNEMKRIDFAIAHSLEIRHYITDLERKLDEKLKYISIIKQDRNTAQDDLKRLLSLLNVASVDEAAEKLKKVID